MLSVSTFDTFHKRKQSTKLPCTNLYSPSVTLSVENAKASCLETRSTKAFISLQTKMYF